MGTKHEESQEFLAFKANRTGTSNNFIQLIALPREEEHEITDFFPLEKYKKEASVTSVLTRCSAEPGTFIY